MDNKEKKKALEMGIAFLEGKAMVGLDAVAECVSVLREAAEAMPEEFDPKLPWRVVQYGLKHIENAEGFSVCRPVDGESYVAQHWDEICDLIISSVNAIHDLGMTPEELKEVWEEMRQFIYAHANSSAICYDAEEDLEGSPVGKDSKLWAKDLLSKIRKE